MQVALSHVSKCNSLPRKARHVQVASEQLRTWRENKMSELDREVFTSLARNDVSEQVDGILCLRSFERIFFGVCGPQGHTGNQEEIVPDVTSKIVPNECGGGVGTGVGGKRYDTSIPRESRSFRLSCQKISPK
jgi:hypothetical protein